MVCKSMKQLIDLLNIPYVFSQQHLLNEDEFKEEYNRRMGLFGNKIWSEYQLEALQQVGFQPIYRFQTDISDELLDELPGLESAPIRNLKGSQFGKVFDPRNEDFADWDSYKKKVEDYIQPTSTFLYSKYQLLLAPVISRVIASMTSQQRQNSDYVLDRVFRVKHDKDLLEAINEESRKNDELIVVLTALEPLYIPKLKGHWYLEHYSGRDIDGLFRYKNSFKPIELLEWLEWTAEQIKEAGQLLLIHANSADPMRDWHELLQLCHPEKWAKLHGDVLIAFDHRFAAEILLRFYEDLVKANVAPPLDPPARYFRGPYDDRLKPDPSKLNKVLMDFGLSPDPSVVLILEGDTELSLVPKVMGLLGIPQHQNYIRLFKAEGIKQDFGLMARLVAVPTLGELIPNMVLLETPPTSFFVVLDAEEDFTTPNARKQERQVWIERIYGSISDELKDSIDKKQLGSLVTFETWKNTSFEYAHFTDRELAKAIIALYKGKKDLSLEKVIISVSMQRKHRGNIDNVWKKSGFISKVDLANHLWPILEKKIRESKNPLRIPIVRILLKANKVAIRTHRRHVGIKLTKKKT